MDIPTYFTECSSPYCGLNRQYSPFRMIMEALIPTLLKTSDQVLNCVSIGPGGMYQDIKLLTQILTFNKHIDEINFFCHDFG